MFANNVVIRFKTKLLTRLTTCTLKLDNIKMAQCLKNIIQIIEIDLFTNTNLTTINNG